MFGIAMANRAFEYKAFIKSTITKKLFTCLVTSCRKYFLKLLMFGNKTTKMLLVAKMTIKDM
jgi:hypothetical protein